MPSMDVHGYQNVSWENISSFPSVLQGINNSGAGYLFAGITYLVFFVLLITITSVYGFEAGILSASFIGLILSILFTYMDVMNWRLILPFVGLIIVYIMYSIWNRND